MATTGGLAAAAGGPAAVAGGPAAAADDEADGAEVTWFVHDVQNIHSAHVPRCFAQCQGTAALKCVHHVHHLHNVPGCSLARRCQFRIVCASVIIVALK